MKLNDQQLTGAKAYQSSKRNIGISARAGTGKTSFLLALQKLNKSKTSLFLAFTNATKDELIKRDPSLKDRVKTTYQIGLKACHRLIESQVEVLPYKYQNIVSELVNSEGFTVQCALKGVSGKVYSDRFTQNSVVSLVNLCLVNLKFTLAEISEYVEANYTVDPDLETWLAYESIKTGLMDCLNGSVGFSDMISFPFSPYVDDEDCSHAFKKYPVLMVDEAQDLSMAQIRIVEESLGGQLVVVGDSFQAIMGFAGGTGDSFNHLLESFDCDVYPLTLCYRCPVQVLDEARKIVPDIQGLDRQGHYEYIRGYDEGLEKIKEISNDETMVVSRVNSDLVGLSLALFESDIAFNFHRDKIEQTLKSKLAFIKESTPYSKLLETLTKLRNDYERQGNTYQLDLTDCLIYLVKGANTDKYSGLYTFMRRLFYKRSANILLGTVHSFKGSESKNVAGWGMQKFPHPLSTTEAQLQQERNLEYVLITRAKENLYLVEY